MADRPALERRADATRVLAALRPEHQTYAVAGERYGKHWSPFQETCRDVRRLLSEHGGSAEVAVVVRGVRHHYSHDTSARAHLAR